MLKDLGGGLMLRRGRADDAEALATFNAAVHSDDGPDWPDLRIGGWTRDLLARPHPAVRPEHFTVVEEPVTGRIVSTLMLIPQTWRYDTVPFGVGRVELVGTLPEYRRRGLIRVQMDTLHGWSAAAGDLVQGITGIPWYYRQFGYEYALALDGGRTVPRRRLPAPEPSAADAFRLRPATPADLPFIARVEEIGTRRSLVSCLRDAAHWRYELDGRSTDNVYQRQLVVIERPGGAPAGFLMVNTRLQRDTLSVNAVEMAPGCSWLEVADPVLRYLHVEGIRLEELGAAGQSDLPRPGVTYRFEQVRFSLVASHPLFVALPERAATVIPDYGWYIRVPDLPAFLHRIAPVLERRLAASVAAGYSGDVLLNFYRDGLRLSFARGRLAIAEPWAEPDRERATASFPDLTFLQLLFGYRSLGELMAAFPDCATRGEHGRVLLDALFPKQPSAFWPVA